MKPDLQSYLVAEIPLTPLKGKRPLIKKWTSTLFTETQLLKIVDKANFGAVLQAHHLVLDIDPRNFTSPGTWERFQEVHELDLTGVPAVKTGGGGFHYYFKKPENINIVESIDGFDGIEFKSKNRQVVIPGSKHPDTNNYYEWIANAHNLQNLKDVPENILLLITRPHLGTDARNLMGAFSIEEVQLILDNLDPTRYSKHDDWLRIMMACHHASAGAARQEFINWSTSDPVYKNDDYIIGKRWDSLSYGFDNQITYKTLRFELYKIGKAEIMRSLYKNDEDLSPSITKELGLAPHSTVSESEEMGPFEYLNSKYCSVMTQNKVVLYHASVLDPNQWSYTAKRSFEDQYEGLLVEPKGASRPIPITKAWYRWRYQRRANDAVLDIEGKFKDNPQVLNLWKGWSVRPNGDTNLSWDYMETLIHQGLAAGNDEHFEYILNWIAYMFQKPQILPEVALVFTGSKGTGKSTLGTALTHMVGATHAIQVTSPDVFIGRFNAHLENKIMIFADEAISARNEVQNARLKAYITEDALVVEGKGLAARQVKNYYHLIIASNNPQPVLISPDERRYAIFKVSDVYRKDLDFFKKLHLQMQNGGYEKFMYDMLIRHLGDWAPRDTMPVTNPMIDQKVETMDPVDKWWYDVLCYESQHPSNTGLNRMWDDRLTESEKLVLKKRHDWSMFQCMFFRDELIYLYCTHAGIMASSLSKHAFWRRMQELTGIAKSRVQSDKVNTNEYVKYANQDMQIFINEVREPHVSGRSRATKFPSLLDCRVRMQTMYDGMLEYPDITHSIDFS